MKPLIISVFLLTVVQFSYGQETTTKDPLPNSKELETNLFQKRLSQQFSTLKLDLSSFSRTDIGDLNNELINYKGKITSVVYDDVNKTMDITHNSLISRDDMFEIIAKRNIKKAFVLSYE